MTKSTIYRALLHEIEQRKTTLQALLNDIRNETNNETKSSAGDKHETARAMAQLEQEKVGNQLVEINKFDEITHRIQDDETHTRIQLGSVVETSNGTYFISVGIGSLLIDNEPVFCLTPASPIGKLLLGKEAGEHIVFNNNATNILRVY
jgi:transcription elongation GreA/GreB family factor